MTPWTLSGPDRQAGSPLLRPVVQSRPLDPLPPRLTPPPPPAPPRLPAGAGLLAGAAVLVGSPWVNEQLRQWQSELVKRDDGIVGLITGIGNTALYGLTWLRWDLGLEDGPDLTYRLSENLRTVLFIVLALWLLRRLAAATPVPPRGHRALVAFAVPVLAAVAAAIGGLVVLLFDDGGHARQLTSPYLVPDTLSSALFCGSVFGVLLAWLTARRKPPATDPTASTPRR
ncbi:hypothetical protein GA0070616_5471 [Micromonospora nigra]|uniref:Uncharacterized protein n=1 Tax=Micromonospora nigra TaxID=145857 RepID=A0A1C6T3V3_9ACTN|nr:hypothetical protein [Micromonospora nigra]SCL36377.1 hypothetical protein GA0070616_5471 [Micromonospora nigra]